MPYSCSVSGKELHVFPANDTSYRIVGRRFEQPYVACTNRGAACETMMVHRFSIDCDGAQIPWWRVMQAAANTGIKIPAGLPTGFAPVSALSGRFVLPALVRTSAQSAAVSMAVSTQDLSPDSVTEASDDGHSMAALSDAQWVTEVRADVMRATAGSNAGHVAASLGGVLLMLFAASMLAAGRWRLPVFATDAWQFIPGAAGEATARVLNNARESFGQMRSKVERSWQQSADYAPADETANAVLMLQARMIEVDFAVAALAPNLLLRAVLSSETETIRARIADLERRLPRRAPQKSAVIMRNLLRDLERISRIANSAGQGEGDSRDAGGYADDYGTPQTIADAYRVLGINPDAAPAVAKKLVDALRMSWHPDHARNESDRRTRESRMKQINAAWDLVKLQRAAA